MTPLQAVWLHSERPHMKWAAQPKAAASPAPDHTGHVDGKNKRPWDLIKTQKTHRLQLSLQTRC